MDKRQSDSGSRPSIQKQSLYQMEDELKLEDEDIDDIIKILAGRKEQIWLPHFLRSRNNLKDEDSEFSVEARQLIKNNINIIFRFLLGHFTESQVLNNQDPITPVPSSPYDIYPQFIMNQKIHYELINSYKNYNFDLFQFCDTPIQQSQLFMDHSLFLRPLKLGNLSNKPNSFVKCIHRISKFNIYVSYSSLIHALDVLNSSAYFMYSKLSDLIDPFDQACIIVSALAHDVGHPGYNNGFMVGTFSKQSLLYNDQSVLENFHCSLLFHILNKDSCNIVQNLSISMFKKFRKYCITLILDTGNQWKQISQLIDLQKHFMLLNKFKNFLALDEYNISEEQNKLLLMSVCIKSADIGHGAKNLKLHKEWSRRIIEEFFYQGDKESELNLDVTPMCDRKLSVTKSQEGFLKAIVLPLFEAFNEILKSQHIENVCIKQIHENIDYWQQQQDEEVRKQNKRIFQQEQVQGKPSFFDDTNNILLRVNSLGNQKIDFVPLLFPQ